MESENFDLKYATSAPRRPQAAQKKNILSHAGEASNKNPSSTSEDVFNNSADDKDKVKDESTPPIKITAYGYDASDPKEARYMADQDDMLNPVDMTMMSTKLNVTVGMKKVNSKTGRHSSRNTEIAEDLGRIDTQEDELDLQTISNVHQQKSGQLADDSNKKNAFGMSHNIFDVSSYGEVQMNQVLANQKMYGSSAYKNGIQTQDQSVSLVQMQDSMAFEDIKPLKRGTDVQIVIEEHPNEAANESHITGKFDNSRDEISNNQSPSAATGHYTESMGG